MMFLKRLFQRSQGFYDSREEQVYLEEMGQKRMQFILMKGPW